MTDFLLELRSEEIPARMQGRAREDLAKLFAGELAKAGLTAGETVTYATPRRLALIVRGLPQATEAVAEEVKGPKVGAPPQALEGFLRKTGLTREDLVERGGVLFAITQKPGRATVDVLAEAIPAIVRAFPWPKSMRWGAASASTESLRWVRPLQGIVALFGDDIVPCEVAGVASGAATVGHRFHHPGIITIGSAADYAEKLRACHVIVDQDERASIIALGATMAASKAGLTLVRDEGLLTENAGLTEWPVPLLGRFDAEYLSVPPEVIQLTARVNQKYFVCHGVAANGDLPGADRSREAGSQGEPWDGRLANAFVCTANIDASDGGAKIVEGNRKVLAARLSDARFFYETDMKVPLEEQAAKLDRIVFHEKLGTVADKVGRVAKLARWLVEEGIVKPSPLQGRGLGEGHVDGSRSADMPLPNPSPEGEGLEELAALAERAARLCKADLVTGMVGEFPELQGLMGGYYARAQGEDPCVADAIRDHYKPVGQGDDVPTAPVTVAVSLADKLDTLFGFFGVDLPPTGSKDPFALRRAAIAVVQLLTANGLRLKFEEAHTKTIQPYVFNFVNKVSRLRADRDNEAAQRMGLTISATTSNGYINQLVSSPDVVNYVEGFKSSYKTVLSFVADRLKVQQREAGVRHDLIDAVFALGGEDDLVRLLARVNALQAFVGTGDGANLLAGYKRAANILKKEGFLTSVAPAEAGASRDGGIAQDGEAPAFAGAAEAAVVLPYTPEPAEAALIAALDTAEPAAAAAVAREDFAAAMAALASLRAPIDAFFTDVTVNDPDPARRAARLALLDRVRTAVHGVADFSRIEG